MKKCSFLIGLATLSVWTTACKSSNDDPTDSGSPIVDVGDPSDQDFLLNWYSEYDADQNTEYLDDLGSLGTEELNNIEYEVMRDMPYGPHGERTSMDVYLPKNATSATPIVLFAHGGGFGAKDKMEILGDRAAILAAYLENNIAVASINYRFKSNEVTETAVAPDWNCSGAVGGNDGCRLDVIYRDGARAVQYLRYRSDVLNIDSDRIGAWGSSAGSQITTWVALVPDLAVADHQDPVLRESTRLQAVGHRNSQVTGPSYMWPEIIEFRQESEECDPIDLWERLSTDEEEQVGYNDALQASVEYLQGDPNGQELVRVVHFLNMFDANIPPFIFSTPVPDHTCEYLAAMSDEELKGKMLHHPRHLESLYQQCIEAKGEEGCTIVSDVQDTFSNENDAWKQDEAEVVKFMLETL